MKDFIKEIYKKYENNWELVYLPVLEDELICHKVENYKTIASMLEMALYSNQLVIRAIKDGLSDTRYTVIETSNAAMMYHKEIRDGYLNMASELSVIKK